MIAQSHFGSQGPYDLLDFFCPVNVSSESRANAFLWLCFHYLEAPSPNPFDDDFSRSHPGKIPRLNVLSDEETALENVDPEDEKAWGEKMMAQRREFLLNKDKEPEAADSATNGNGEPPKDKPKPRGRGKSKTKAEAAAALLKPSKRGAKGDRDFYAERELGFPFAGSEGDHGEGLSLHCTCELSQVSEKEVTQIRRYTFRCISSICIGYASPFVPHTASNNAPSISLVVLPT